MLWHPYSAHLQVADGMSYFVAQYFEAHHAEAFYHAWVRMVLPEMLGIWTVAQQCNTRLRLIQVRHVSDWKTICIYNVISLTRRIERLVSS